LSRASYGWMEFVPQLPCQSVAEVQTYYQRAGALLCLLYALESVDCHLENLIAHGSHPVLIDLETLFHPYVSSSEYADQARPFVLKLPDHLRHLLLVDTLLLPHRLQEERQAIFDGDDPAAEGRESTATMLYKHTNTDAMHYEKGEQDLPLSSNVVRLGSEIVEPVAYVEQITAGFTAMYAFLVAQKETLLSATGPLTLFLGCRGRCMISPARFYVGLLHSLRLPEYLRDASAHWAELEILKQYPPGLSGTDEVQQRKATEVTEAERLALQQLDIPLFTTQVGSHDLETDAVVLLQDFFPHSVFEQVQQRLRDLDQEHLARQLSFIRSSLLTTVISPFSSQQHAETSVQDLAQEIQEVPELVADDLVAVAYKLAEQVRQHTILDDDGTPQWSGLLGYPEEREFGPIGDSLYKGSCGIALFLATLEQITGGATGYRSYIMAALYSLCTRLRAKEDQKLEAYWDKLGIGGGIGLGSIVYGLCAIGQAMEIDDLLECAYRASLLITEQRLYKKNYTDIIAGSAGAILGLLKLYDTTGERELLQRAVMCGTHLLEQRVQTYPTGRSWRNATGQARTGLSHGVAGIAYALLRLAQATGQEHFLQAAEESLGFERFLFDPVVKNWPLFQEAPPAERFVNSWCYGAPGIGLARLDGLVTLDTPLIRAEIAIALETTQAVGFADTDTLCCGNCGRLELWQVASEHLNRPDLRKLALRQATALIQQANQNGGLFRLPHECFSSSLFRGTAGIGFQLLRLAYPQQVPGVLLWR
jgi:type 2 lantibiotic biosynthesis protein LanM